MTTTTWMVVARFMSVSINILLKNEYFFNHRSGNTRCSREVIPRRRKYTTKGI